MSQKMLFGTVRSGKIMLIYDSFYTPYATPQGAPSFKISSQLELRCRVQEVKTTKKRLKFAKNDHIWDRQDRAGN